MKLLIVNGSPRGKRSNSKILIDHFITGFNTVNPESVIVEYLAHGIVKDKLVEQVLNSQTMLIVFPLYTDCMPGMVKEFFETLIHIPSMTEKKVGFIVQSGFPESIHSTYVERYLKKFTGRVSSEYLGTIIKGGIEGIQVMPAWMTKKIFNRFQMLGKYFAKTTTFEPSLQALFRKPVTFSFCEKFFLQISSKIGLNNFYWDSNLKKNGAFNCRDEKPYILFGNNT